ncbi:MAG: response regulator transcription factor, partial [Balneolaceae bacterium]|nr:response regulator transcription factor [Balneolaceae bacterium]
MAKIKVLIADDHEILRFGISTFLNSAENINVVGEASSGDECIELFKEKKPDVCVLDISMPGKNGIETTKAIREIDPNVKVLILSMHIDKAILDQVLEAGINGYLLKDTEKTELLHGIESIAKGQQVFSDPIQKLITKSYLNGGRTPHDSITSRELEV